MRDPEDQVLRLIGEIRAAAEQLRRLFERTQTGHTPSAKDTDIPVKLKPDRRAASLRRAGQQPVH
jgi:hypothetical protein